MKKRIPLTIMPLVFLGCNNTIDDNGVTQEKRDTEVVTLTSSHIDYPVPKNIIEEIIVTLTIDTQTDEIVAVANQHVAHHPKSERYMQWFDDGIEGAVLGKKIQDLQIDKVNGASDTTYGFNQAVLDIQEQYENYGR